MRDVYLIQRHWIGNYARDPSSIKNIRSGVRLTKKLVEGNIEHDLIKLLRDDEYYLLYCYRRKYTVKKSRKKVERFLYGGCLRSWDYILEKYKTQIDREEVNTKGLRSDLEPNIKELAEIESEKVLRRARDGVKYRCLVDEKLRKRGDAKNKGIVTRPDFVLAGKVNDDVYNMHTEEVKIGEKRELSEDERVELAVNVLCLDESHKGVAKKIKLKNYDVTPQVRIFWSDGNESTFRNPEDYFDQVQEKANEIARILTKI